MKITTARRIIKESKKGIGNWTQEDVDRAHQAAHLYHDKVSKEKAKLEALAALAQMTAARMPAAVAGQFVKDAAERARIEAKKERQAAYRQRPLMAYVLPEFTDDQDRKRPAQHSEAMGTLEHSRQMQPPAKPFESSEVKDLPKHSLRGKVEAAGFKVIDIVDAPGIEGEVLLIEKDKAIRDLEAQK